MGEAADTAKIARTAGKAVDVAKTAKRTKKISSVSDNAANVAKKYPLSKKGFFGKKGINHQVIESDNQFKTAEDFYKRIKKGGVEMPLPNGKGVKTTFADESRVVYRVNTTTKGSPAIDIFIESPGKIKGQKIHFIKKEK